MNKQEMKTEAIPLISYDMKLKKFSLNPDAESFISKLTGPLGVISVAGMYRTGKSYLLNRMILNSQTGFNVGPTINPCTKGLWIWPDALSGYSPDGSPLNILLIDTEGIGALDEDSNHDTKIFTLSILLSSYFLYNSVGSIDENAIQNLSFIVNLTRHIQVKNGNSDDFDDYSQYFPSFMWIVRDFTLQLVDEENEPITSKQYLERGLAEQKGNFLPESAEQKNKIRRMLKSFFKERDCFTMIRPLMDEENLQCLEKIEPDQLRPDFLAQIIELRKKVMNKIKPKMLNGKKLNGDMFVNLIKSYINNINNGDIPNIENAWSYLCKNESLKAKDQAVEKYESLIRENTENRFPINEDDLKKIHKSSKELAINTFKKKVVGGESDELLKVLKEKLSELFAAVKLENEKETKKSSIYFLTKHYFNIEKNLNNGSYKCFADYEADINLLISKFNETGPEGPNSKLFLYEFIVKSMINSTQYFINNCSQEIETTTKLSNEKIAFLQKEIQEMKNNFTSQIQKKNEEVLVHFTEKDELVVNLENLKEDLNTVTEEKEKNLIYFNETLENSKVNYERQITELKHKISKHEDDNKTLERKQISSSAEFEKEKLLMDQKLEYLEGKLNEYEKKEKQFNSELMNIKKEQINNNKEKLQEYESKVEQLTKKLEQKNEKFYELENSLLEKERIFEKEKQNFEGIIQKLNLEINDYSEKILNKSDFLDKNTEKFREEISTLHSENDSKIQSFKESMEIQEKKIREQEETFKIIKNKLMKENAILKQDNEFLDLKIKELENQVTEHKKATDSIISTYESKSNLALQNQEEYNKKLEELKSFYLQEIKKTETEHEKIKTKLQQQVDSYMEKKLDLESKLSSENGEMLKENEELKQRIEDQEREILVLTERSKLVNKEKSKILEDYNEKTQELINDYETQIEDIKNSYNKDIERLNNQSEEDIKVLKNIYQNEKIKLEKKERDEKFTSNKKYNDMVDSYEKKLREELSDKDDEIERLQENLDNFLEQHREYTNQAENEMSKAQQKIENYEKTITSLKESHQKLIEVNTLNFTQQIEKLNEEKKNINNKCESLLQEINKKDRENASVSSKKEQLEEFLTKKENLIEKLKKDFLAEQAEIEKKFNELKDANQLITDEAVAKKLTAQRELALSQQQSEFQLKRILEVEKLLEDQIKSSEEEINQVRFNLESEYKIKINHLTKEKENLESKLINKKKEFRDSENQKTKTISMMEKERAVLNEKMTNFEIKKLEIIESFEKEKESLLSSISALKEKTSKDLLSITQENNNLKQKLDSLTESHSELSSIHDRDKLLWEEKFKFLDSQKEQYKKELSTEKKKFEECLESYQDKGNKDRNNLNQTTNSLISNMEQRHQTQIKELSESNQKVQGEMQAKIKELEAKNKLTTEKYEAELKSKSSFENKFNQRLYIFQTAEEQLKKELEEVRADRDKSKIYTNRLNDKEISTLKSKVQELELKCKEAEKNRLSTLSEHQLAIAMLEREKNENNYLLGKNKELAENVETLDKKQKNLDSEMALLRKGKSLKRRENIHVHTDSNMSFKKIGTEKTYNVPNTTNKENNSNNRVLLDNSIIEDFNYQHTPQNKNMILDGKNMLSSKFFSRHPSNDYYDNHLNKLKSEGDLSVNMSKEEDSSKDL